MLKIYNWSETDLKTKKIIMDRAMFDISSIQDYVKEWIDVIKNEGDQGILKYTKQFDNKNFDLKNLKVTKKDIKEAYKKVDPKVVEVMKRQISISRQNAQSKARQETILKSFIPGVQVGYKITPIESVGLAVPAGQVPLPTVMQILAVTAKAAGVPRVVACFPPTGDYPEMLIAADIAGVDEIYRVGGIAGIAAMSYGTETIKPVLKIVGPGSIYTQTAKMLVFGKVVIDMVAGPSEAVILADEFANPIYCAADILARAEHAPDAAGVLITYSETLAQETKKEVERQIKYLSRSEVIKKSLEKYSCTIVVKDWQEAIDLTNDYSPEHLEIQIKDPFSVLSEIKNAGSIFLGENAPVAIGDYASGTNHILPTGNWPKMASAVSVETFQKSSEVQYLTREGLQNLEEIVDVVSGIEKLDAHWNSVNVRINKKKRLWDEIKDPVQGLTPLELQQALTGVTIGGTKTKIDSKQKKLVFTEYVKRAFPEAEVLDVNPIETTASLNSVSGIITIQFKDKKLQTLFGKVHIESNTRSLNPLGAEQEYVNAEILADAGWPVVEPLTKSKNPDYPLLLYPVIDAIPLFDKLETSYLSGEVKITDEELNSLELYNQLIGEQEVRKIKVGTREEAIDAPVQTLLLKRFETNGRIDQWYTSETTFALPGLNKSITWAELLDTKWNINGQLFDITLSEIVDQARKSLAFVEKEQIFLTISHGDDHAGNVRLANPPVVFDPAFAGWNPVALDVKALAHTGFLPMAAMYYSPKGLKINYQLSGETICISANTEDLPMFKTQEMLAKQIIDARVLPLLKRIKDKGGNIGKEKQRIKSGLAACALLTVNIAQLLEQDDGRAVGLLPMAIMFASLQGLPMLEYLNRKIDEL